MPTPEKARIIQDTQERIADVRGLYLTDFSGLTVESMTSLRKKCREQGVQFHVVKNTLLKRAFNSRGITQLDAYLVGNTGVVFSASSEMAPAKILSDFARENEKLKVKAAVVDGRLFDARAIATLATLPSREVLLSQGPQHVHRADDPVPRGRQRGARDPREHGGRAAPGEVEGFLNPNMIPG